jgi:hypothetical protein
MKCPSNLLSPVFALLAACAVPAAMGADDPQATKRVGAPASPTMPLMVVHNSDGTFTIQKAAPKEAAKEPKAKQGLVIPPQVVVPMIPAHEKRK